jgi:hypothetical protein
MYVGRSSFLPQRWSNLACCIPRQIFPGIELSVSGEWKQLEALGKKKRKIALRYTVSMYDEMTYLIQAVPHSE